MDASQRRAPAEQMARVPAQGAAPAESRWVSVRVAPRSSLPCCQDVACACENCQEHLKVSSEPTHREEELKMAYNAMYSVTVKAPQQKVFDYVADVSRHGEWGSADDNMKASAEKVGPPATGSRYKAEG